MTGHTLVRALNRELLRWIQIAGVTFSLHSGGGTLHVTAKNGKKFRILVDEEE